MANPTCRFPEDDILFAALSEVLGGNTAGGIASIVRREVNNESANAPSERVICRLEDGRQLPLLCKYATGRSQDTLGLRSGPQYEELVHRCVLRPSNVATPRLFGSYVDPGTQETWLVFEYFDGCIHANKTADAMRGMELAAQWIGRFHADQERRLETGTLPPLDRYDADHYLRCARQILHAPNELHQRYPWLRAAVRGFKRVIDLLAAKPLTVVHGDYYPDNILYRDELVYPIDWEWAALGAGEIDLASLTDRWPEEVSVPCVLAYQKARWPSALPYDLESTLDAARLYLCYRYIGMRREWMLDEKRQWRFDAVQRLSEKLGVL